VHYTDLAGQYVDSLLTSASNDIVTLRYPSLA
jgi:hypothetical protein